MAAPIDLEAELAAAPAIVAALVAAQSEFARLEKGRTAKGTKFSYRYSDLASLLDSVVPPLTEHGIFLSQPTRVELVERGALVHVSTRLLHVSGETMETDITLPATATDPQSLGSVATYARRYALLGLLGVSAHDDDDDGLVAASGECPAPRAGPDDPISDAQRRKLWVEANRRAAFVYGPDNVERAHAEACLREALQAVERESSADVTRGEFDAVLEAVKHAEGF